ncbi:hypothetical protein ABZ845_30795 [Streptomyces sp. NPDC047022]|uniref:hypothetical protein n=1 Tax=Streptomyces sp. NPDC047022 TaxID=3155737 RepID=UPI0033D53C75
MSRRAAVDRGALLSGLRSRTAPEAENPLLARTAGDPLAALKALGELLPDLDDVQDVADDDVSELTAIEARQKDETEEVIRTAVAVGNAAIWIIAEALERAAKGKWWRRSHPTYAAYVGDLTGRSASYVRRLRLGAPLALETAARTGRVPNPGQMDQTRKAEQQHGTEAAILLFHVVSDVAGQLGGNATAETLGTVRQELPPVLPDAPEEMRATIERVARRTLGDDGADDETGARDDDAGDGVRIRTPRDEAAGSGEGEEIEDAEIIPDHLATLQHALKTLKAVNRAATKDTFAQGAADAQTAEEYDAVRLAIVKTATAIRNKALHGRRD